MKLKCKNYGLWQNTEVENEEGRVLVTNGLSVKQLVSLWRWYYNIPFWEIIKLEMSESLYNSATKVHLSYCKSVSELFACENVVLVKAVNLNGKDFR